MKLSGKRALITGASSGIGLEFARQIAAMGADIVICARRKSRLEEIAEEVRAAHGHEASTIAADLSDPASPERLYEATEGAGQPIDLLINNAGFGTSDLFVDIPWETTQQQLQLNINALTELTWRFANAMSKRGHGYILNVASVGAYQPVPHFATYAASKAYVRNFTEALAYEMAPTGVKVCCLSPGPTSSEFADVAGHEVAAWQKPFFMSAERCAQIGLSALLRGRRNIVSGWGNSLQCFMTRFLPRRANVRVAAMAMTKPEKALAATNE